MKHQPYHDIYVDDATADKINKRRERDAQRQERKAKRSERRNNRHIKYSTVVKVA